MDSNTRQIHPLRTVKAITVSKEMGKDLGHRSYFWLSRRYTMTLDCGHEQSRVSSNFHHLPPEKLMPKKVRCTTCPTVSVPQSAPKAPPKYDHLASTLAGSILGASSEPQDENRTLSWVLEHGPWIDDPQVRAATYGAVALYTFDTMLDHKTVKHSTALRAAITTWANNPTADTKAEVRKATRRLYNTQNDKGNDWYTARALICLGRIASLGTQSAKGIVEALTWDKTSREGFYERLWEARHLMDHHSAIAYRAAGLNIDPDERERYMAQTAQDALDAKAELSRIWHDEYPKVGSHHLPLLLRLLDIYSEAKQQAQAALAD